MDKNITPRRLSVSTWSLKRELGTPDFYGIGEELPHASHRRDALLRLPAKLKNFGIDTVEICHFHLPSYGDTYVQELRASLTESNIELWSFLVDDGDITHPENGEHDMIQIGDWFAVAEKLGAKNVRVIAGKTRDDGALNRSRDALRVLDETAQKHRLRLMTENWHGVLETPRDVSELLEKMDGTLGLCFDFGNWNGENKYCDLKEIAHLAESCHAKAHFEGTHIDRKDYVHCLDILREADFSGPYTLIFDGDGDEWRGLEIEMELVRPYLS